MADGLTIDSLSIEVGYQANNASGGVDKLTASLNNLKSAIKGNGLQEIVTQLSNLSQVITAMPVGKLQRAVASLEKLKGSNGLGGVSSAVQNTASTMPEVSGTVEATPVDTSGIEQETSEVQEASQAVDEFTQKLNIAQILSGSASNPFVATANYVRTLNGELKRLAVQRIDDLIQSGAISNMSDDGLRGTVQSWVEYNAGLIQAQKEATAAAKEEAKALREAQKEADKLKREKEKLAKSTKKATSAFGSFLKSIGRIALYRAIRSAIKMVTQAFSEGVKNVALYSKAIGEVDSASANKTMSEYATVLLQVKNSIGACVAPLLQALLPAITAVANGFINAVNALNMFISKLQGKTTWTKANSYAVDYADSLDSASSAAKELKKQTMGFDELNILNSNSSSGSSSSYDYSKMFSEETLDVDALTDKFNNFGATVANIFNWLSDKVHSFAETLATTDWVGLGKHIVEWIAQGIKNIDWKQLGLDTNILSMMAALLPAEIIYGIAKRIVSGIAAYFSEHIKESTDAGGTIGEGIWNGITDALKGFVVWIKDNVLNTAVEAFCTIFGLDIPEDAFGSLWKGFVDKVVTPVVNWVTSVASWIYEKIIAPVIEFFTPIYNALASIMAKVWEIFKKIIEIFAAIGKAVWTYIVEPAWNFVNEKFIQPVIEGIKKIWDWIDSKIIQPLMTAIEKVASFVKSAFKTVGTFIADFIGGAIKSVINGVLSAIEWTVNKFIGLLNGAIKVINKIPGVSITTLETLSIPRLASGGILNAGQMFIANEAGPELVGNIGRKTAVMNSSQIIEAVSIGVANAVARAMGGTSQAVNVNVDGDTLFSFVVKKNNERVYSTGASPLLV